MCLPSEFKTTLGLKLVVTIVFLCFNWCPYRRTKWRIDITFFNTVAEIIIEYMTKSELELEVRADQMLLGLQYGFQNYSNDY